MKPRLSNKDQNCLRRAREIFFENNIITYYGLSVQNNDFELEACKNRLYSLSSENERYKREINSLENMNEAGITELHHEKNNAKVLYDALITIEDSDDGLMKGIAKNSKERYNINKMIHANKLFNR